MSATLNGAENVPSTLTDSDAPVDEALSTHRAHLFVILECARPSAGFTRHSLSSLDRVVVGRAATRRSERRYDGDARTLFVGIPDARMSAEHAALTIRAGSVVLEDLGSRNGTRRNGALVEGRTPLADGDFIEAGHSILRYRAALPTMTTAQADVDSQHLSGAALATVDPALGRHVAMLERVARSDAPLVLLGETGTGKEVLARAVHRISSRTGPLVAVNCAAIPATLVESQFFGHVRGAFSGATSDALGYIRSAGGGTLLLDEIGDLPPAAQAALLRALQEREVVPVGAVRPVPVDFRVVAATHKTLEELVSQGQFRADLLARLAGFTFTIPALRHRPEDLGILVAAFAAGRPMCLRPAAGRAILQHSWPCNVRELHRALEVAVALTDDGTVDVRHLPSIGAPAPALPPAAVALAADPEWSEETGELRRRLVDNLREHRGNITRVSVAMGKARSQVQRWVRRFRIDVGAFRD